jgi:hypothetical protein
MGADGGDDAAADAPDDVLAEPRLDTGSEVAAETNYVPGAASS